MGSMAFCARALIGPVTLTFCLLISKCRWRYDEYFYEIWTFWVFSVFLSNKSDKKDGRSATRPSVSQSIKIHLCSIVPCVARESEALSGRSKTECIGNAKQFGFYPRDAMLARVFATATCLSVCVSVCPSVRHTPVLCLAERKQDREMYTFW